MYHLCSGVQLLHGNVVATRRWDNAGWTCHDLDGLHPRFIYCSKQLGHRLGWWWILLLSIFFVGQSLGDLDHGRCQKQQISACTTCQDKVFLLLRAGWGRVGWRAINDWSSDVLLGLFDLVCIHPSNFHKAFLRLKSTEQSRLIIPILDTHTVTHLAVHFTEAALTLVTFLPLHHGLTLGAFVRLTATSGQDVFRHLESSHVH